MSSSTSMGAGCMNVLGFVNGMIGGSILVLPVMGLSSGFISSPFLCIGMGIITFYTCWLQILHVGKSNSIKEGVLAHFNQKYSFLTIYSSLVWLNTIPALLIYFKLIVLQVSALLVESSLIAPMCSIGLFLITLSVQIWKIEDKALAFGIISIFAYFIFLIWALLTSPAGQNKIEPFGDSITLASALITSYSIINVISQNIFKLPNKEDYLKIVAATFLIGSLANTFFLESSFSIVNRVPLKQNPETIMDYFEHGGWQNMLIEIFYLIRLLTIFPNFLQITKVRFYEIIKVEVGDSKINWHEIIYILAIVMAGHMVFVLGVDLQTLMRINGSVFCFFNMILTPIIIHLKCVFFDKSSGNIEGDLYNNLCIEPNSCKCDNSYSSKWILYLETFALICVCFIGLLLMGYTLIDIF